MLLHDSEHEHHDLGPAGPQGCDDDLAFIEEGHEFQHAEDSEHAQQADDEQILGARGKEAKISGEYGEKINKAKEAARIGEGARDRNEAKDVLDREERGEGQFGTIKPEPVLGMNFSHAVEHDCGYAGEYHE